MSRFAPLLLLATLACDEGGRVVKDLPDDAVPQAGEFMVVVLPDTQVYAWLYPETFEAQTRWIAEHADEYNIVFVSHVGDVVQNGDAADQWENARAAYAWLDDIDLPHGFSVGAHDFWVGGSREHDSSCMAEGFSHLDCGFVDFIDSFGPDRYADRPWFGGASPTGRSSWQIVAAEGYELLFLHLPQDTPAEEVAWAGEVLDAHPGALVHLTTHRYLYDYRLTDILPSPFSLVQAGRFNHLTYLLGGQGLIFTSSVDAETLFTDFVAAHPNIWAVHCGHVDAEWRQTSVNDAGLPVYEILTDFQDMADGGGGWMRLLTFKPASNEVEVRTWSPVTGEFRANGDGFDHSIDIIDHYKDSAADALSAFGVDMEEIAAYINLIRADTPERAAYYDSLYGAGGRDSEFVLAVEFDAYVEASR